MSKISQNLKENFTGSMGGKIAASVLAAAAVLTPMTGKLGTMFGGSALAQDIQPVKHHREMTALEKGDEARRFSIHNEGVGVFVNLADNPNIPSADKIMELMEPAFRKLNIDAVFYFNQSKGNTTTVTYFVEGTPFEYTLGNAFDGFQRVTKAFRQRHPEKPAGELHSSMR